MPAQAICFHGPEALLRRGGQSPYLTQRLRRADWGWMMLKKTTDGARWLNPLEQVQVPQYQGRAFQDQDGEAQLQATSSIRR